MQRTDDCLTHDFGSAEWDSVHQGPKVPTLSRDLVAPGSPLVETTFHSRWDGPKASRSAASPVCFLAFNRPPAAMPGSVSCGFGDEALANVLVEGPLGSRGSENRAAKRGRPQLEGDVPRIPMKPVHLPSPASQVARSLSRQNNVRLPSFTGGGNRPALMSRQILLRLTEYLANTTSDRTSRFSTWPLAGPVTTPSPPSSRPWSSTLRELRGRPAP